MKIVPWFSHDFNARDDEKILNMRMKHGWNAYGLYWAIIEMLRAAENYKMKTQYDSIAFALQTDSDLIKTIIESFELFSFDNDFFYSKSLLERMIIKDEKSHKASLSAKKRWENNNTNQQLNANALQQHSECNANAMQVKESKVKESKVKESKVKEIKEKENIPPIFEELKQYCTERKNGIDPQKFYDYYESKGWVVGRAKMKSWKASVRTWENNGFSKSKDQGFYNEI